jgi:hypothetical protein
MAMRRACVGKENWATMSEYHQKFAIWLLGQAFLTTTVKVKLHKGHRTVDAVVVWILIFEAAYPREVGFINVLLKVAGAVLQYFFRVVLVE